MLKLEDSNPHPLIQNPVLIPPSHRGTTVKVWPKTMDKLLQEYRSAVLLLILLDSMVIKDAKKMADQAFLGSKCFANLSIFSKQK